MVEVALIDGLIVFETVSVVDGLGDEDGEAVRVVVIVDDGD